ncbi:MAG: HAD-IIIA family hydrolase [Acidobacteriota bacterium]|nr:HAD-IIIA family hydrolase [Acidobacteriota bacterium]NLH68618.1 HAD-IIIA family hydrolase [Brooklawnia sp.]
MQNEVSERRGMLGWLRPDFIVAAVLDLTAEDIQRMSPATRAVCLDIDGTITDYHAPSVPERSVERLKSYHEAGLHTFIISNCHDERVTEVHRLFGSLVTGVLTPADAVDAANPDDRPGKHIKPAPDMLVAVSERYGLAPRELLMVGDQIFKDVLSARRAGAASVLVPREGSRDHFGVRIFQRPVETMLRAVMHLPVKHRSWPRRLTRAPR